VASYVIQHKNISQVNKLCTCGKKTDPAHVVKNFIASCIKVLTFLIISPTYLLAMAPLTDSDLAEVCGGSGVSINPDITLNITINSASWGDSDGISGYANPWPSTLSGGRMGANNIIFSQLHVRSRTSDSYNGYDPSTMWKPITIDVATSPTTYNGATFVRLGLGALEISWDHMQLEAALGPSGNNLNQKLGDLYMGKLDLFLNPSSYIDIYNGRGAGQSGVTFTWNSIVDHISLECISWGDSDGLPSGNTGSGGVVWIAPGAGNSAGWIGLHNIEVGGPTSVTGSFAIDILTSSSGVYSFLSAKPETITHISFPTDFILNTNGPIIAEVR
jgi:hypothetical protein